MTLSRGLSGDQIFTGPKGSLGTEYKEVSSRKVKWSYQERFIQFQSRSKRTGEKNNNFGLSNALGTISAGSVNVMSPSMQQDSYLDDEVGDTIRYIKEKFGDAPLIEAYEAALDTFKESDKKWKEYWEEEARLQSLFEED